jgi:hypothetical protein
MTWDAADLIALEGCKFVGSGADAVDMSGESRRVIGVVER